MEMRILTHSLRQRPTSLLLSAQAQQPTKLLLTTNTVRYASSKRSPPPYTQSKTAAPTQPPAPTQGTSDFDQILSKLNINNTAAASDSSSAQQPQQQPSQQQPGSGTRQSVFGDALSLGRAVGSSAATESYRPAVRKVALKLGPSLGRQVHVQPEKGTDLAAAMRILQATCNANRMRGMVFDQRFHVRRGQVRKNRRMQRWRKLFKFSFQQTVSRIERMRAQGW
ncbi:hypothetical protein FE257_011204 [Aspergillus nanangensis]|uniref:Ribosomal protein S21 n=1 Tax=Aspergillus nanangensis TaxID=2582783 RepID=A0AAD4GRM0_ASPNN|nr:hypothetical protein FE257_011204 [Aspergillus nanangensis]